jgi:hypothetical protein
MPIQKNINKNFFKTWSRDMAYVLGFFSADGNLIKTKRNTHFFAFDSADKELIESIRTAMNSEHLVSRRISETSEWYRLQIGSKEMFEDLLNLGVTPLKTYRMRMPSMPKQYLNDFIRGYFDGDGNVWLGYIHKQTTNCRLTLHVAFTSGSEEFLTSLQQSLRGLGLKGGSLFKVKNSNCSRLSYALHDALKLSEIMYNVPHGLYLNRKMAVFEKFNSMRL